jgi:hypothetical protein
MAEPSCFYNPEGVLEWRLDGKLHRINGPAQTYPDGSTKWFKHGVIHRVGGPAIEDANGHKVWYQNGHLHREDGPAIEYINGTFAWYIEGIEINPVLVRNKRDPRYARLMEIRNVYEVITK